MMPSFPSIGVDRISLLQETVLARYDQHARSLPWRLTDDPYQIWISETMLCQTQVSRVVEYYHRRLDHIPTITTLANIETKKLLQLWSGLGYNSRALRLQDCARILINQYHTTLPDDYRQLISLPGIGDYTASAILAFAYHRDIGVVDTNIRRVLVYRFDLDHQIPYRVLKDIARQTIPPGRAKLWRNAVMDYGSVVLTSQATGIKSVYKQSPFVGSTRQVRSRILHYLLTHDFVEIDSIQTQWPRHDVQTIVDKMCGEQIVTLNDHILTLHSRR